MPPLPDCSISLGPTLQSDEMISFFKQAVSSKIFGLPSNLELRTFISQSEIYLNGLLVNVNNLN